MIEQFILYFNTNLYNLNYILTILTGLIHLIFAGAVAKDAGSLYKRGLPTILVSGVTWSFTTLIGGVFVAVVYWLLHHSTLTKPSS